MFVDYDLYLISETTASKMVMLKIPSKMPILYTSSMHRNCQSLFFKCATGSPLFLYHLKMWTAPDFDIL